jgi:hypothetical protein
MEPILYEKMKNTSLQIVVLILFACILTACDPGTQETIPIASTQVISSTATNTPTITVTQTATSFIKSSSPPSATPKPTKTPILTPTSTQELNWAENYEKPIVIKNFSGSWSPTNNEMVSIHRTSLEIGVIALASHPDFSPKNIRVENANFIDTSFIWSADGNWIVFGGPHIHDQPWTVDEGSVLWKMDRNGENQQQVLPDDYAGRWLEFIGWMDNQTIATSTYEGGGHNRVEITDILDSKVIASVGFHGLYFDANTENVAAAINSIKAYYLFLITREEQPVAVSTNFWGEESNHIFGFPYGDLQPEISTIFKDWLPGKNLVLVQAFTYDFERDYYSTSRLLIWDLTTNAYKEFVSGGIDGKFSPSGDKLASITSGPAGLNKDNTLKLEPNKTLQDEGDPYLQLLEMSTNEVLLSLPIVSGIDPRDYTGKIYETKMAFSPNNQYFAFLSPGLVVLDEHGWPVGKIDAETDEIYLNLLDLENKVLLLSAPCSTDYHPSYTMFVWSPNSDKIVFRDNYLNWQVYNVKNGTIMPVTASGGDQTFFGGWSSDGHYLSLEMANEDHMVDTFVIAIP